MNISEGRRWRRRTTTTEEEEEGIKEFQRFSRSVSLSSSAVANKRVGVLKTVILPPTSSLTHSLWRLLFSFFLLFAASDSEVVSV